MGTGWDLNHIFHSTRTTVAVAMRLLLGTSVAEEDVCVAVDSCNRWQTVWWRARWPGCESGIVHCSYTGTQTSVQK